MSTRTYLTCEQFEAQCLAGRLEGCELIDGEVVPLAPSGFDQSEVCGRVAVILGEFVYRKKLGRLLTNEVGMHLRTDPPRSRGADLAFVSFKRIPKSERPRGFLRVPPELIVEVVGEKQTWEELADKIEDYRTFGVEMVWVVDPNTRTVKRYPRKGEPEILHDGDELDGGKFLPGFKVLVARLFTG